MISRQKAPTYADLPHHADASILVNATPVGMYPHNGISPVSLNILPNLEAVLDLVYHPARTRLLLDAQEKQIPCLGGLTMLVEQAIRASELFTGSSLSEEIKQKTETTISRQTENLILIGMPGCGKTTVGKLLAEQTGKTFADADTLLQSRIGPFDRFFADHGESAFREAETALLAELGKQSGLVIATGGGCVTRAENRDLLRQNGIIIRLLRDPDKLPVEGRPLSVQYGVEALSQQREPLYCAFADMTADNNGTPEETVQIILNRRMP